MVPATEAHVALLDRVFTRIGASDNVAQGKSTFLVEMEETAVICRQATAKSLVILDEVGRGTSTFDGVAIAQAVIEYLVQEARSFCLFATHYHELNQLSAVNAKISCYHAASMQSDEGIVLLHKIVPGVADGSFGLEVAKMAQLPSSIVLRAQEILRVLSKECQQLVIPAHAHDGDKELNKQLERENQELKLRLARLSQLSLDEVTPRQALEILWALKESM